MGIKHGIGAVLGSAALLVGGTAAPAAAQVEMMYDPAGDSAEGVHGDIRTIKVNHRPDQLRVVIGHGRRGRATDGYLVWIDTDARRAGPEFLAGAAYEVAPDASVRPVRGWDRSTRTEERCPGRVRAQWNLDGTPSRLRFVIPRRCIGTPNRVRVAVASIPDHRNEPVDWAPGERRLGPWVQAG